MKFVEAEYPLEEWVHNPYFYGYVLPSFVIFRQMYGHGTDVAAYISLNLW